MPGSRLCRPYGTRSVWGPVPVPVPGIAMPGSLLCRPCGTRSVWGPASRFPFPALPCRALSCDVPAGLGPFGGPRSRSRHCHAGLSTVPSLRDSICLGSRSRSRHCHAGLSIVTSLRDSSPFRGPVPGPVPGIAMPGSRLCRPCGTGLGCGFAVWAWECLKPALVGAKSLSCVLCRGTASL